ncbi:MAG: tRNA pseudouridine synthase A, partial [Acetivibrio ethanolgignens]
MKRYMLEVAYDGTNYCGWQVQPGKATIEGELNKALSDLLKQEIEVIGASRTDSGVHGLGNVAVFDAETRIPGEKLKYALNQRLPEDIRVQTSREVASDFHPRHCDSKKTYEYRILCREVELPTERLYA